MAVVGRKADGGEHRRPDGSSKEREDKMINEICTVCGKQRRGVLPQWWNLTDYHGAKGIFCPVCFEKVRHKDARPVHPIAYRNALRKMPDGSALIKAHSKTEYKRLVAQGANVLPPTPKEKNDD